MRILYQNNVIAPRICCSNSRKICNAAYVIRHASQANVWAIRWKLDNLNYYKAKLFSARARGATDKIADYERRIESAQNELLENLADAVQNILQSSDKTLEENPNPVYSNDFITMTAAEVFADIVHANMDAVMKCFGGNRLFGLGAIFGGGMSISSALKAAVKMDKDHKTDGHKKVSANKL